MMKIREGERVSTLVIILLASVLVTTVIGFLVEETKRKEALELERGEWARKEADWAREASALHEEAEALSSTIVEMEDQMAKLSALSDLIEPLGRDKLMEFIEDYPSSSPFDSDLKITSRFGEGTGFGHRLYHEGTDMVPRGNWYVHPMWSGVVSHIGIDADLGKHIIVNHGDKVRTIYAHLQTIYYEAVPGEHVDIHTNMGFMGSTGLSTAAHLHLVLEIFDGEKWVAVDNYPFLRREA